MTYQDPATVNELIMVAAPTMLVLYALLFLASAHNIVRFVLQRERYKNLNISLFYVLLSLNIVLRMAWLALILHTVIDYYPDQREIQDGAQKMAIFLLDVAATYTELLVGFQQASSMEELYLMVKETICRLGRQSNRLCFTHDTLRESTLVSSAHSFFN